MQSPFTFDTFLMLYCTELVSHGGLDGRGIGVMFRLCRSDVMLRIVMLLPLVAVMRCVPYFTRKAHITFAENITHEVRTTFRVRNTSLKKAKSKLTWLFFGVAPKCRKALKLIAFSHVSMHFLHKTTC